jgi:hypothetical protein
MGMEAHRPPPPARSACHWYTRTATSHRPRNSSLNEGARWESLWAAECDRRNSALPRRARLGDQVAIAVQLRARPGARNWSTCASSASTRRRSRSPESTRCVRAMRGGPRPGGYIQLRTHYVATPPIHQQHSPRRAHFPSASRGPQARKPRGEAACRRQAGWGHDYIIPNDSQRSLPAIGSSCCAAVPNAVGRWVWVGWKEGATG